MTNEIYIDYLPGLIRAARLVNEKIEDFLVLRDDKPQVAGNQYIGRIAGIDKGLGAAFVDIGLGQSGFLPLQNIPKSLGGHNVSEGTYLCVEVVREAFDGKGVRLKALVKENIPNKIHVVKSFDRLGAWLQRQKGHIDLIEVTDAALAGQVKKSLDALSVDGSILKHSAKRPDLFEAVGVEEQLELLLQTEILLPSGGNLLLEQGRTLTAIDVNKGAMQHNGGVEMLHYHLNLEAAAEIARQLRLRNIAGRVIIDFPYMKLAEYKKKLQAALKACLSNDSVGHKLLPLYMTGLQELTRKRSGLSLQDLLLRPVGIGGLGQEKDPTIVGYEALRWLWSENIRNSHVQASIAASYMVIQSLKDCAALPYVEEKIGKKITLSVEPGADVSDYAVFE
ncbi:ribonuclease E/G [Kiloniella litopenaei]|uniref:ribonuclease E/G n=1 Tax=Kiloniella litopenaei TaxID=1549748 RepID=UPI003BA9A37E